MKTSRIVAAGIAAVLAGVMGSVPLAARQSQPAQSPALAKDLVAELTKKKQDCVLAKDPEVAGQYIAALHLPGLQLLVVSAKFADPAGMEFRMFSGDCMGGYADLNAAVTATDRIVINDLGADGLVAVPKKEAPRDGITRGGKELKLDGSSNGLKAAKMTPDDFQKTFNDAEQTYSTYLRLLIARLKG
jgi:hypothetical protein